jgi:hypothetical protein
MLSWNRRMRAWSAAAWVWLWITGVQGAVVINEIHHTPAVKQQSVEFIELVNTGTEAVVLDGWRLAGAVDLAFPAGTRIAPGGYLVAAQDPAALAATFGVTGAVGPWTKRLSGRGERVSLLDSAGSEVDRVNYGSGFPWPTVGSGAGVGNSIELIHPSFDNSLGGNWRPSKGVEGAGVEQQVIQEAGPWRIWKGTSHPSVPAEAWRSVGFDDSQWMTGPGPVGYDPDVLGPATTGGTRLSDMRGGYRTFYLRQRFDVSEPGRFMGVRLEALYDDGFRIWLNGVLLGSVGVPTGELGPQSTATQAIENNEYQVLRYNLPPGVLREQGNVIAVHVLNANLSDSSDCFFDARLILTPGNSDRGPTPGRLNRAHSTNAPPAIGQVSHQPGQPKSGEPVRVTAHVTDPDGVAEVRLEYQVVRPGEYIRFDTPEFAAQWTVVPMTDDSTQGDETAGDGLHTVVLPGTLQNHRHLMRYRIVAADRTGQTVRVPYVEDEGRNFAWFCHDGIPAWTGAVRPGAAGELGRTFTVDAAEMNRLPVYHLIARKTDVEAATWRDRSRGDSYHWTGTLVYDGQVYDHIRFRPRGGVWRYAMGKNMWKFDFNRGRDFRGRDNWGRPFPVEWSKLNLGASIQQGDYLHRGEHGMFESVGFRMFQMAGATGADTAFVQFRVVDDVLETNPADPYAGDFWGVYLAVEQLDGRYLDARGLPDGNLYKMEGGFGDPNNLGHDGPVDASDLRAFLTSYNSNLQGLNEGWWRTNLNLHSYFGYQAVVQGIHHYDIADGKNYFYYRNPGDGRWEVMPWDLDLTWSDNMYRAGQTGGDEPFKSRVLSGFNPNNPRYPGIAMEFRNRIREIRDLLWNGDEAWRLIDEYARLLRGTAERSLLDVDRAQWDYNPVMVDGSLTQGSKAGWGRYYQSGVGTKDFAGMLRKMREYVLYRGSDPVFSLATISRDPAVPSRPTLLDAGAEGHPLGGLRFGVGDYAGVAPAASVRWRVAEVTRPDHPAHDPTRPLPYEIDAVTDSGELPPATASWQPEAGVLKVGRLYRARVRFKDVTGRTSHWSEPLEFTVAPVEGTGAAFDDLRITELMYDPTGGGYEFVELHNRNPRLGINLAGMRFTSGIQFEFAEGSILEPGGYGLLLRSTNVAGFLGLHGLPNDTKVLGIYGGALANEGEQIVLRAPAGEPGEIRFTYGVEAPWPVLPAGRGHSLVPDEAGPSEPTLPEHWRASTAVRGSPGRADPLPPAWNIQGATRVRDGIELEYPGADSGLEVWVSADLLRWERTSLKPMNGRVTVPWSLEGETLYVRLRRNP